MGIVIQEGREGTWSVTHEDRVTSWTATQEITDATDECCAQIYRQQGECYA